MIRFLLMLCSVLCLLGQAAAVVLVDIPLDQQINIGLGDAISDFSSFQSDPEGGYVRRLITADSGAGEYYFGPNVDLVRAGYGPYIDLSAGGITVEYTARYYQGGGNTNPYADAPIFIQLMDVNGRSAGLGISYGPQPFPTYPEWINCTDDMSTAGNWPDDPEFDISRIVGLGFFGTDWFGVGDDFVDIKGLRITTPAIYNPIPIADAKGIADGETVELAGFTSASFAADSQFYIQDSNRCCGVQVRAAVVPNVGAGVVFSGTVHTDEQTGEMYVQTDGWSPNGSDTVDPIGMTTRSLGGTSFGRQQGVHQGVGLNNIGLLVRCFGKVTGSAADASYAYINDGTDLSDGGPHLGVRVDLSAIPTWLRPTILAGDKMVVTGASTMYLGDDGNIHRSIRVRNLVDYFNLEDDGNRPKTIKAYVVNFDPICPSYGNVRTHEVFNWNNPTTLSTGYINDLRNCSNQWCQYEIVGWYEANYHPYFEDGFQYTPDDYVYAWINRGTIPMYSGTSDYPRLVTDKSYPHNRSKSLAERVAAGEIDEVFFFGAPGGFAGWEAAMAGPSPFFVNGGTYYIPEAGRNFIMMGFNYERGVDCMLEDFCHRSECIMTRVYDPPNWWFPTYPPTSNWDKFRMFDQIHPGAAACGICHYAPNSTSDYDWGNPTYVWSTCDDWLYNWPNLQGDITKRWVNCSEWGNGDMRLHHIWWLNHIPKTAGINPDGMQNNWWKYLCDFNSFPESQ